MRINFRKLFLLVMILFILPFGIANVQAEVVRYQTVSNFPPYSYIENEKFQGFDVDLGMMVFAQSEYEPIFSQDIWDNIYARVKKQQIDTCGLTVVNEALKKELLFSTTVKKMSYGVFTLKGHQPIPLKDIEKLRVGVCKSGLLNDFSEEDFKINRYVTYYSIGDAITALKNGDIDAIFDFQEAVNYYVMQNKMEDQIQQQHSNINEVSLAFGVHKGNLKLLSFINKRLNTILYSDRYEMLHQKYFNGHSQQYQSSQRMNMIVVIVALITFFALVFVGFQMYIRYLRKNIVLTNETLVKQHEWMGITLASIGDAVIAVDREGLITLINPAALNLIGISEAEALRKPFQEVVLMLEENHFSPVEFKMDEMLERLDLEPELRKYVLVSRSAKEYTVQSSLSRIMNEDGEPMGVLLILQNITEQRIKDGLLKKEKDFSKSIVDSAEIFIIILEMSGSVIHINRYAEMITRYKSEDVAGRNWIDVFVPAEGKADAQKIFNEIVQETSPQSHENQIVTKQGLCLSVLWNNSTLCDLKGEPFAIVLIGVDISERKAAEIGLKNQREALKLSEERYSIAVSGSNEGLWDWDIVKNEAFFSARWKELLGYEMEDVENNMDAWMALIHPDERDKIAQMIHDHINQHIGYFQEEIRMKSKNGEYRWMFSRGKVIWDEFGKAIRMAGSHSDITDRKKNEEKIHYLAYYDDLTGLPNREYFTTKLKDELGSDRSTHKAGAVILLDLDNFKNINDALGHAFGDLLLVKVSKMIESVCKEDDFLARFGGDEFIILKNSMGSCEEAEKVVIDIINGFQEPWDLEGREYYITASVGITLFPEDGINAQTLVKNADTAMYHAKECGKNKYEFYNSKLNLDIVEKMEMQKNMRGAIEKNEFVLFYQPLIDIKTNKIFAGEALIRWVIPGGHGHIPPMKFIPLAEESGLIIPLGEWVLRTACRQNKDWQDAGFDPIRIAVNLSAKQFQQKNLVTIIAGILQETKLQPKYLELEITESIAMQDLEHTLMVIEQLKGMDIKISLDDFGTGYSSLNYLKKLPIHTLKMDKSFVDELGSQSNEENIAKAVISLAHNLNLKVTAEGVETEKQLKFLTENGCDHVQGYLFSKPVPSVEFEGLIKGRVLAHK